MKGLRYRLFRMLLGTVAVTVGMLMEAVEPAVFNDLSPRWSLVAFIAKMVVGAAIIFKGLEQYQRASFPPGDASCNDPVNVWIQARLTELHQRFWPAYYLAMLVLIFTPLFTAVILPLMLLRPFYVAAIATEGPKGAILAAELRRTWTALVAMGKSLIVMTVCSCIGLAVCLTVLLGTLWLHYHVAVS